VPRPYKDLNDLDSDTGAGNWVVAIIGMLVLIGLIAWGVWGAWG